MEKKFDKNNQPYYDCPECDGIVVHVQADGEDFWGCGDCGNVWASESELTNDGFGDAWFLTTLLLLKEWSPLWQVIAMGDGLNHAIFMAQEINEALSIFVPEKYVEINAEKQMRATNKARAFCDKTFDQSGAFGKVEYISGKLKKLPFHRPAKITDFFTEEEVSKAYKKYLRELRRS